MLAEGGCNVGKKRNSESNRALIGMRAAGFASEVWLRTGWSEGRRPFADAAAQRPYPRHSSLRVCGYRAGGIRTRDLLNPIQAHYQAVLRPDDPATIHRQPSDCQKSFLLSIHLSFQREWEFVTRL